MTKPVRFEVEAAEELLAASSWYENERSGLGGDLLRSIYEAVDEIGKRPETFPLAPMVPESIRVRRALVRRFPYAVVFLELADEIRVLAIAHSSRKPGYWRER